MNNVLEVNNVSKSYRTYSSELKRVLTWFGIKQKPASETYTLQNINFSIRAGEAVGIIGVNGAGKSTLLKIITGTLHPTSGSVKVNGKISAILELGMGFHPDLTGRQNAYHSAGLMGYTREQIDAVINEIEGFAEIGEYFDQPVRLYSSGMQVRVAFAVATAYRPEILIIDEALSVGDAYFQHKSFAKIKEFREAGTSLLFVSHDKGAILALCDRAILIEKGHILQDGEPEAITDYYNALLSKKQSSTIKQEKREDGKTVTVSGTGEASIVDIGIYNSKDEKVELVGVGESIAICIRIKANKNLPSLALGYMIKDRLGQPIFGTNSYNLKKTIENVKESQTIDFRYKFNANFGVGSYSITVALHANDTHIGSNYEWKDQAIVFEVANLNQPTFVGSMWLNPDLEINYVER